MNYTNFILSISDFAKNRGVKTSEVIPYIEDMLQNTLQKHFKDFAITVNINHETGELKTFKSLKVVEHVLETFYQISKEDASKINSSIELVTEQDGDVFTKEEVETPSMGRVDGHFAKHFFKNMMMDFDRNKVLEKYTDKIGDVTTGIVSSVNYIKNKKGIKVQKEMILSLGDVQAIIAYNDMCRGEAFRVGDRVKFLIRDIKKAGEGPWIIGSRSDIGFIIDLFMGVCPELENGDIEITGADREPGVKTKIIVKANQSGVFAGYAMIGPKGSRIQKVLSELNNERIDIIEDTDDMAELVLRSLKPAEILKIVFLGENEIVAILNEEEKPKAFGKFGHNVRMTQSLLGIKLSLMSPEELSSFDKKENHDMAILDFTEFLAIDEEEAELLFNSGFKTLREVSIANEEEINEVGILLKEAKQKAIEVLKMAEEDAT